MYILYSIPSTASCHLYVIHVSLATLNNATFICLHTLHYSSHMYILYSIPSTASCHLDVIHVSLATLNNATFIYLHTLHYSSHMYILYSIPSTTSCLCCSVPSLIHISLCTHSSSLYTCVHKVVVVKLLG